MKWKVTLVDYPKIGFRATHRQGPNINHLDSGQLKASIMVFTITIVFHLHVTTTTFPQPSRDGAQQPLPHGPQERRRR